MKLEEAKKFAKENPKVTKVAAAGVATAVGVVFAPVLTVLAVTGYVGWNIFKKDEPPKQP